MENNNSDNRSRYLSGGISLLLLGLLFLAIMALSNQLFKNWRLDLTEGGLYTISQGTKAILNEIDEPIKLRFYYSKKAASEIPFIRTYGDRVESLLQEFVSYTDGKLELAMIDPELFSEDEDDAASYGLQQLPLSAGLSIYFGLTASNAIGESHNIPAFQFDQDDLLEYQLAKLIHQLNYPESPTIALLSSIELQGGVDARSQRPTPGWAVYQEMQQLYEVETVQANDLQLTPERYAVLMLVQPVDFDEATLYAIDQYAMAGGKILAFIDPLAETAAAAPSANASKPLDPAFITLLEHWGIRFEVSKVVADIEAAMMVSSSDGQPVRHLGISGLGLANINQDDVASSGFESINLATPGALLMLPENSLSVEPLLSSGEQSALLDAMQFQYLQDPSSVLKNFVADDQRYHMGVRLSGEISSLYREKETKAEGFISETKSFNAVIIADTDVLSDRLWVQQQNFFGQTVTSAWADNGALVVNLLDNLSGSANLLSIRSRGRYSRPFTVVEALQREAQASYAKSEQALQQQLQDTEQQLQALQSGDETGASLLLSPQQEQTLLAFQQKKLQIRKQLREVSHKLVQDIEALGNNLKLLNIFLLPLLLTTLVFLVNRGLRRRRVAL